MNTIKIIALFLGLLATVPVRASVPLVAIHDSELTRALESQPASATTPQGAGTTGFEWWPAQWHYFVQPESLKEALRSDGTLFTTLGDADISAGKLLDSKGQPQFPILISLAAEAMNDSEIQPLLDYVNAGGTLFVGSSSFTRKSDGTTRGDFALANPMGVHMASASLSNWILSYSLSKQTDHRLVSHIPSGVLTWKMPWSADEITWGTSPTHAYWGPHPAWHVQAGDAQVLVVNDSSPYLLVKNYGKGRFIYHAAFQPLIGHGGWAPGMYAYAIFRNAIQWAFEAQTTPTPRLSPWPYAYDAALNVRHDFENYQDAINGIEASAQYEHSVGAKGDYYFCTGTLRVDMGNSATTIASLQRAVTHYNATIGPHNGGLRNPNNPALTNADYDYWHWGLDEALDVTPSGYASGKAYAQASLGNAFQDVEGWLAGLNNAKGLRVWVSPYFNSTREDSYDILGQLGVVVAGEQKLTPFPHWTLSTGTSGKRYPTLSLPASDWYVGTTIAQSMEYHSSASMHAAVDFYYNLGALINIYSHTVSTSGVEQDYVAYSVAKPRVWVANATDVYSWWLKRSSAQIVPALATSGTQTVLTLSITGATDPQTAVEAWIPLQTSYGLEVRRNGTPASADTFRTNGQLVRVLVGTSINTVEIRYSGAQVTAANDSYSGTSGQTLTVAAPGVLGNDTTNTTPPTLTAALVSGPAHGTLNLSATGAFTYTPAAGFSGTDAFTYRASDNSGNSATASASITVASAVNQPPTVSLTSPADGASYLPPATITLTAAASDTHGTISKVEFYNGATLLATRTASPYSVTFTGVPLGSYTVTAKAYDNTGAVTTSAPITLLVTANVNTPPTVSLTSPANGSFYTAPANLTLSAAASDTNGTISKVEFYNGATLLATSTASPYTYAWNSVASGTYALTARAYDNQGAATTSGTINVSVNAASTTLYSTDFSQNTLAPWNTVLGTWTVPSGVLLGTSGVQNYAAASYGATWTDYTLQGRIQFPAGAYGGGLGGRLNATTGERYGAWVYPEGSSGGSSVLKLVKFRSWNTWSGTPMKQVSLPGVGTTWHTLKLTFLGARIQVFYDGTQMMDVTDSSFDSRAPYLSGGISADLWTYLTTYKMNVDDIVVTTGT